MGMGITGIPVVQLAVRNRHSPLSNLHSSLFGAPQEPRGLLLLDDMSHI